MNKIISIYLFIIFLTGCNSELSEEVVKPTLTLERIDISVSSAGTRGTSKLTLAKGNKHTFIAIGHYSDHSSKMLTDLSIWRSSNENVGYFVESGKLIGKALGVLKITATKDNVTSNTVSVDVYTCTLTGASCIDIFDTGSGKLFTNSPSKIALHSLGGSVNNGFTQEIGTSGPAGDFFWFTWENASRLCATYGNESLAGRTNWRLATKNELKLELFNTYGNMFNARGWPVRLSYWSSTSRGPGFLNASLKNGNEGASMGEEELYASCVSVP